MNLQYNHIGNACHVIYLTSTFLYIIAASLYSTPEYKIFDEEWIQHGFCVVQENVPYWNSHDLCMYSNVLLVIVGLIIRRFLRASSNGTAANTENNEVMKEADEFVLLNLMGHLGHGIFHGVIATRYRTPNGFEGGEYLQSSPYDKIFQNGGFHYANKEFVQITLILFGLLFGLLNGVLPKVPLRVLTVLALIAATGALFVKLVIQFGYYQLVIISALSVTQLRFPKEKKDNFVYAVFALATIPLSIIPWFEGLMCRDVASKFGGHLMYDSAIGISIIVSYCIVWRHYYSLPFSAATTSATAPNNEKAKVY